MSVFYLVLLILSTVAATADIILQSVLKIRNFGFDRLKLSLHAKTVPLEDFIPCDITYFLIFLLAFSVLGLILLALEMPAVLTVFCGICFGMLVIFGIKHIALPIGRILSGKALPKSRPDSGDCAKCTEKIAGDGYGSIEFVYKGKSYFFPAMSANESDIEAGEKVTVVHKEQGICWVEKIDEELAEAEE